MATIQLVDGELKKRKSCNIRSNFPQCSFWSLSHVDLLSSAPRNSWARGEVTSGLSVGRLVHRWRLLLFINQVTLSVIINADRGELEPVLGFSVDWVGAILRLFCGWWRIE